MKKLLLIFSILPFMVSCQNKRIDWSAVNFPIPLSSISKEYEILPYLSYDKQHMDLFKSFDHNLLYFEKTSLASKMLIENSVIIYVSKKDKNIIAVTLFTEDEKTTDQLLQILTKSLGKTDYHYFYNENKKEISTQKIWKKDNKYYTLNLRDPTFLLGKKTKTASFTIFNTSNDLFIKWWFHDGGDFSGFYGQYLDEKEKPEHKGKNYKYNDFVAQMDRENKNSGTTSKFYVK